MAHDIVVREGPADPAIGRGIEEVANHMTHPTRGERLVGQELERVAHLHLVVAGGVVGDDRQTALRIPHLTDRGDRRILVHQCAEALEELDVFRAVLVIEVVLVVVGVHCGSNGIVALLGRQSRIVAQFIIAEVEVDRVEAEAIDTAIEPEAGNVEHGILDFRIVEVEVRLRGQEIVLEILQPRRIPGPGRAAEDRQPVVGR